MLRVCLMPDVVLSVVCTIYNCEKYVDALMQSILVAANNDNIEFLFIDDCSADDSRRACARALARNEGDIRFQYKQLAHDRNRGISAARNTGITASKGRYIGFLDGDDALLAGYAECVLSAIRGGSEAPAPEILEFSFREFVDDSEVTSPFRQKTSETVRIYSDSQRYKTLFQHGFFSWLRVYQRELVEATMFTEDGRAYEDIAFSMDVVARAREVKRIDAVLVGYRKCAGSITSVRDKRFLDQFTHLSEGMKRNRQKFGGGLALECRYLLKLFIVLLKAMKIHPATDRLEFYRAARAHSHDGDSWCSKISTTASRGFSSLLFYVVRTLRMS